MDSATFEDIIENFMREEVKLLELKGYEYSEGVDRLQNFREIADFLGMELHQVALVYMLKHISSIQIAAKNDSILNKWYWSKGTEEGMKQRVADARNYLLLFAACVEDKLLREDYHEKEED